MGRPSLDPPAARAAGDSRRWIRAREATAQAWPCLPKVLKANIKHVKEGLRRVASMRVRADLPKWACIQGLLLGGDRRVAELLVSVHKSHGNWTRALKDSIINADFYVHRKRSVDEILPWDFIDHSIRKEFLIEEYGKALRAMTSPPCLVGQCKACGVCK